MAENLYAVVVDERGSSHMAYAVRARRPEDAIERVMQLRQQDGGNGNWAHVVTVTWLHDERLNLPPAKSAQEVSTSE